MEWKDFFPENERPLDRIPEDGGFCSIFRTFACVGDSLSSGEFQLPREDGKWSFHDMFEYSWGQFMARTLGSKVYNFSRGGMTAKEYIESYGDRKGFWNEDLKCQAYFVALGVNDIFNSHQPLGSVEDVKDDWRNNEKTFAGYYAAILQRYAAISPGAKFFLISPPRERTAEKTADGAKIAALLHDFAARFPNTYVIDLHRDGPVYDDAFRERFFLYGHMNPMGYALTAKMVMAYTDYIIRHDTKAFDRVGFLPH